MNQITIFTDGSSRGNPGPGGWGAVVIINEEDNSKNENFKSVTRVIELGGGEKHTTNNRMELMAAIEGLKKHKDVSSKSKVQIYSDSSYVINGITKWVHGWKRNGWKTKTKDEVVNIDLWKMLDDTVNIIGTKNIIWEYVGGHIGIAGNERCDVIATAFADGAKVELYDGSLSTYAIPRILDVSHDEVLLKAKKSATKSKSSAKAYSYASSVGGKIEIDHTWAECEKRVKGVKGARFKKSFDANDEKNIIDNFKTLLF